MKLSDFILLDGEQKKSTVLHEGILIAKRTGFGCFVFLFKLDDYYVETYCNLQSKAIQEYQVFQNTKQLSPYLEAISIEDLLN